MGDGQPRVLAGSARSGLADLVVLTTHRRRRREYEARFADPALAHLRVIRLRSPAAVASWLEGVDPATVESSGIEREAE